MKRPTITKEMITHAAKKLAEKNGWNENQAKDIADKYGHPMDGYKLAKKLDDERFWEITTPDVEALDTMDAVVSVIHDVACRKWERDNNIMPEHQVGTMTTLGEITGISEFEAASYLIRPIEDPTTQHRLIVHFEDVRLA